ncbi:MAG: AsmA family protein [Pseudomonadota bacterium]
MAIHATWLRHRMRWVALAIGVVVLALLVALAIHVQALLQPQRFTDLLERELASVGIKLDMQSAAEPTLFPRPAVRMQSFSLTNSGSATPFLQASGATIVVPWRALLRGEVAIERVEVEYPRIDLAELKALLLRLPSHKGPPRLPTIVAGVHMTQGTLTNGGAPLLFELSVDTGELVPGRPFRMDASARSGDGRQITGSLDTVPSSPHDGTIDFNPIRIAFGKQAGASLQLEGQGQWRGGEAVALQLHGDLHYPSLAPPAASSSTPASGSTPASLPAPRGGAMTVDKIALEVLPPSASTALGISVNIHGDNSRASFHLQPTEFGDWWQRLLAASPQHPPGPLPFTGEAEVQKLDLGWLKATGLSFNAGPDLKPAPATSVVPAVSPATASSAAH